jgi:sulfoxide reductase heme-binding subunit YedZ
VRTAAQSVHLVAASVGFFSVFLLWISVVSGTTMSQLWTVSWIKHSSLSALHKSTAVLGLTLGIVHGLAQLAVPNGSVRVIDEVVPFANKVDPIGVGFGTIATELLIAIALSAAIQRRIGHHRWRALHSIAFATFTITIAHAWFAGSDVHLPVALALYAFWGVAAAAWLAGSPRIGAMLDALRERKQRDLPDAEPDLRPAVHVDPEACVRFGFCEQEAPALFRLTGRGRLAYRSPGSPQESEDAARAAAACPARAIKLARSGSQALVPVGALPVGALPVGARPPSFDRSGRGGM